MIIKVKAKIKNLEETEKASMLLKKRRKYHKKQMVVSKRNQLKLGGVKRVLSIIKDTHKHTHVHFSANPHVTNLENYRLSPTF